MTMKFQVLSTAALAALFLAACGGGAEPEATTDTSATMEEATTSSPITYIVDPDVSNVTWRGVMLGVKEHTGNLKFKPGSTITADADPRGGTIVLKGSEGETIVSEVAERRDPRGRTPGEPVGAGLQPSLLDLPPTAPQDDETFETIDDTDPGILVDEVEQFLRNQDD